MRPKGWGYEPGRFRLAGKEDRSTENHPRTASARGERGASARGTDQKSDELGPSIWRRGGTHFGLTVQFDGAGQLERQVPPALDQSSAFSRSAEQIRIVELKKYVR